MVYNTLKPKLLVNEEIFTDIIGQEQVKHQLIGTLLSQRHALIIGSPGIGKTTLAKNLATILPDHKFIRIQGSPDLAVEDLLGDIDPIKAMKFGPLSKEAFNPGKIFKADNGVLFFDELNRCPEKLQNALLQVLQERKATIGTYDVDIDTNFIFIATMNPEDTNTEKLSDVLLDRFDVIYMSYPENLETELNIVRTKGKSIIKVNNPILRLMVYFVRWLRENKDLEKKPSVRASLGLYERSQANALMNNRTQVTSKDFSDIAASVLAHRIRLKPSVKYLKSPKQFIKEELSKILKSDIAKDAKEGDSP